MRILHISTRLILGGSQENTVLSCEGQALRGHEVHLAFGPILGPEGTMLPRVQGFNAALASGAAVMPITTHEIPSLVREVAPMTDLRCVRELRALIDRLAPDIVHTHSSKAGIVGRVAAWRCRSARPAGKARLPGIVHTVHGPPFMPVMPHGGSLLRRWTIRAANHGYTLAERYAARRCDRMVCVADAMTEQFLARGIGERSQFVTVRSGMDTAPYLYPAPGESREEVRASLGLRNDDFVIGTIARLAEHKGHDDLLTALIEKLRENPRWKLLWVGDGWWRERLVARARRMGVRSCEVELRGSGAVEEASKNTSTTPPLRRSTTAPLPDSSADPQLLLTGLVPPERIPSLLRAMDVLAHPSSREGLPRTVPQALLAGVCPVAYDADGTREACIEMETGRLVRVGDIQGLSEAVLWCSEHPAERRELAARGRTMCVGVFSAEAMVEALEHVYTRALALAHG